MCAINERELATGMLRSAEAERDAKHRMLVGLFNSVVAETEHDTVSWHSGCMVCFTLREISSALLALAVEAGRVGQSGLDK